MKTWLTKFKISNALDDVAAERERMPNEVKRDDLRRFRESLRSLDCCLKSAQSGQPVPAGLHDLVMRAVRGASRTQKQLFAPTILRWLPAPALALLVVAGVWWILSRSESKPQSMVTAAAALEQSLQLTQQAPAAVLAPLSQEMENLNRDFRNAVEVLVASVP